MKNIKKYLVLMLAFILIISTLTLANAAGITEKISAVLNGEITVTFNGKAQTFKDANGNTVLPISYNGTTYLPVRAVSGLAGLNVDFDASTNTVKLTDKSYTENIATSEYNRKNPAPINTNQTVTINNSFDKYTADVIVTEIIDGSDAWNKIKNANMFNREPKEGYKYILAKIKLKVSNVEGDKAVDMSTVMFKGFSNENVEYADSTTVVTPDPQFDGDVYEDGTLEGYVSFEVKKDDVAPKFVFGQKYDGTGGVWFKLSK